MNPSLQHPSPPLPLFFMDTVSSNPCCLPQRTAIPLAMSFPLLMPCWALEITMGLVLIWANSTIAPRLIGVPESDEKHLTLKICLAPLFQLSPFAFRLPPVLGDGLLVSLLRSYMLTSHSILSSFCSTFIISFLYT